MIAEVMGAGMLSLPHCVATLGWIVGLSAVAAFGALSAYSGVILTRTKMNLFPDAESFGDLAFHTVGPTFGAVTRLAVICTWALLLPFFLLPSIPFLPCQWSIYASSVVMLASLALLMPLQLQTLHFHLVRRNPLDDCNGPCHHFGAVRHDRHTRPPHEQPQYHASRSMAARSHRRPAADTHYIIRFGLLNVLDRLRLPGPIDVPRDREGDEKARRIQIRIAPREWLHVRRLSIDMRHWIQRARRMRWLSAGYYKPRPRRIAVGLLLAFHLFIAYLITGQPLHRAIHTYLFPNDLQTRISKARQAGPFQWLCVTVAMLLFSLLLSNAVPFFDQFQALLGSLTGAPTLAGWPALFLLRGYAVKGERLPIGDRLLCCFALYLLAGADGDGVRVGGGGDCE